jgi:hypothetical protein
LVDDDQGMKCVKACCCELKLRYIDDQDDLPPDDTSFYKEIPHDEKRKFVANCKSKDMSELDMKIFTNVPEGPPIQKGTH